MEIQTELFTSEWGVRNDVKHLVDALQDKLPAPLYQLQKSFPSEDQITGEGLLTAIFLVMLVGVPQFNYQKICMPKMEKLLVPSYG